jgi:hypothetical protein
MTADERAAVISSLLDFQVSAALGARDAMRPASPSWRSMDIYAMHLIHFKNQILKHGGSIFSPEFEMPAFVEPIR